MTKKIFGVVFKKDIRKKCSFISFSHIFFYRAKFEKGSHLYFPLTLFYEGKVLKMKGSLFFSEIFRYSGLLETWQITKKSEYLEYSIYFSLNFYFFRKEKELKKNEKKFFVVKKYLEILFERKYVFEWKFFIFSNESFLFFSKNDRTFYKENGPKNFCSQIRWFYWLNIFCCFKTKIKQIFYQIKLSLQN